MGLPSSPTFCTLSFAKAASSVAPHIRTNLGAPSPALPTLRSPHFKISASTGLSIWNCRKWFAFHACSPPCQVLWKKLVRLPSMMVPMSLPSSGSAIGHLSCSALVTRPSTMFIFPVRAESSFSPFSLTGKYTLPVSMRSLALATRNLSSLLRLGWAMSALSLSTCSLVSVRACHEDALEVRSHTTVLNPLTWAWIPSLLINLSEVKVRNPGSAGLAPIEKAASGVSVIWMGT